MSSTTDNEQRFAYLLSPEFQIVNTAGKPLTGGWIEVYIHGTRVKYYCFSDFDGTLHPFQIPLDSLGSNIVLASPTHAYDIYIYNKFGALVMSRYNVVPACNAADIVEDVVVIDSPDETINVTCDGGSNWHLEVNTDLIATTEQLASVSGDLQDQIDNKKDLQLPYVASGSVTKTITKIEQNENGEIEVTYSDIDLPPQVPNIDIISPSGTIDVSSTVNPATNTKTFKIDIHKTKMDFFDGYCGKSHYEDRSSTSTSAFGLYVDQWDEYKYQGDFIANSWQDENNTTFKLNSGLYLITASIRYQMNSDYNKEEYIRIATGAYNGLENGTRYKDWSYEKELGDGTAESSIQVSFIRNVEDDDDYTYMNGNHDLYFYPYLPVGVNYAFIDHLQIVKLDSIAGAGGGSGPRYAAGYGIEILDDIISVATGTVVTNNYFNTVVSSINNEINEISTTIQNVTGDITELNEAVTNIVGVTGDFATNEDLQIVSGAIPESQEVEFEELDVDSLATTEYVDNRIASAAGDVYEAGQYVSIENNVINVTGVQPAGDYATNEDLQIVSGAIPESEAVEFEELDLAQFAQASAVTVIQNQINNVTGDINNINEAVTNIIGATGDYATEEYVDEAIAAVSGTFTQQQSDWTQHDDTKVDYIKHKPREVNLVAGANIAIEQQDLDVIISATGIPSLEGYATEQYVDEAVSGLENYEAGQYVSIQNHVINVTGVQPAGDYATEQYVDEAVAAVTGQPFEQVNSDWLATSGVQEILNKPDVFQLIAGDNIDITPSGNDLVISASSDVTKAYVDEQIAVATGMIPEDTVSHTELNAAIDAATGMIPEAQVNADWLATSGKAEILNKPQEEAVEFEEVNLEDYALASAIPSLEGYATEQYVDAAIDTVTGMIPSDVVTHAELNDAVDTVTGMIPDVAPIQAQIDELAAATGNYLTEQVNADWNATSGVSEILNKPESEEVQFEEVDLSVYALASAIPSLDGYATEQYVDEAIAAVTGIIPSDVVTEQELSDAIDAATGLIPQDTVTHVELANAIDAATGLIPDVSNFVTQQDINDSIAPVQSQIDTLVAATGNYLTEQVNADWNATSGVSEILNKPEDEAVEFEEVDLADYALASAIPSLDGYATEAYVDAAVTAVDSNIFWAITNSTNNTTYAEITAAVQAGKKVLAVNQYTKEIFVPTGWYEWINAHFNNAYLHSESGYPHLTRLWITSDNEWHWDNFTIPYNGYNGVVIDGYGNVSVTGYATEQYVDNAGYATEAYVDSVVTGYATEAELATVSGTLEAEIQTVSAAIPDTSIYATETDLQIVSAAIPESESVEFEELDLSDYALASAIPDVSNINTAITNLVAATGDYLQSSDLNGYATEAYVDAAITGATFEQVNSDWNATSGVAEILNKPVPKEVEFKEVDLSDFALASAVPDVTALEAEIQTVSAAIPDTSSFATETDLQTVSGAVDAVSGSIPESEEVEFEEVDLSDYAPASAIPSLAGYATETYVNAAVSGKQDALTGITDVQVVNSLPASPVATVLYLIPEA